MEFFLDTADLASIREAASLHLLDGITTNPSLVAKTGQNYKELIEKICEICKGPVSVEVLGNTYEDMMKEARQWAKVAPQIVVKIPLTTEGLKAVRTCSAEGIKTNVTLCFSSTQALCAAKAQATYISPFIGRIDDITCDQGFSLVTDILQIYKNYDFKTKVLVASIRHYSHILQAAKAGAHCATIPPQLFKQLITHPLTDKGLEIFEQDSKKILT